ncbi:hypothetical protein HRbin07_00581 [bacterium HR07]|uniref:Uncharacterized protein n=1 Tax=Acetithermum autotrophicum TaxID=1446466 RepID=H5SQY7_ACEAU|nr:hypothetical protein HGMM_OP2C054 [Candidatus Acetothermum autotrophicum]GBC76381.1 hypothetical protein HRbin07_00581 [bacterium HR07]
MAIETLAETVAASETWISVWHDDSEQEVYVQYGYVDISMPVEDFEDFVETLVEARAKLAQPKKKR